MKIIICFGFVLLKNYVTFKLFKISQLRILVFFLKSYILKIMTLRYGFLTSQRLNNFHEKLHGLHVTLRFQSN